jgi:hypothetical protein
MDELLAFVHARLDDEEEVARYSGDGRWAVGECVAADDSGLTEWQITNEPGGIHTRTIGNMRANHIARHDPARTLRDVHSRRATLIRCQEEMLSGIPRLVHFARMTVWEMAQRWNDHDDYKESWKP